VGSTEQRFRLRGGRWIVGFAAVGVLVVALLVASYLYDRSRRDLIAPGVSVAGIDVGGLRAPAARKRLSAELRAERARVISVRYRGRRFTLTASHARLTADVNAAVNEAIRVGRGGWFVSRSVRGLLGDRLDAQIEMPVSYSHRVVKQFVARVEHAVDRPARDASVSIGGSGGLVEVTSRRGARVDAAKLRADVDDELRSQAQAQPIVAPVHVITPHVTTAMLAARYPTYIIVDRPAFTLRLYQRLALTHTYSIAVGRAGLETPAGLHHIVDKQVNPSWHVPHSSWAGSLAGKVIPPGPEDPLVARWMAIDDLGDGIHGTNEPASIGSAASHGCIRMLVPDVIQLYSLTPLGTPVYVI
jgi:lipoprotein-anchoring transpeptidase ErfK/SrfK